jgi:hypothetical protein
MTKNQMTVRVVVVGVCVLIIAIVDSLVKGNGGGFFGELANDGSPWLLLAFLSGAFAGQRRLLLGALIGLGATLVGLMGYYFVDSFVMNFGPHSWPTDLRLAAVSGKEYFALAILSGTVFGALGAWWRRRLSIVPVVVLGLLFVVEALVRAIQADVFVQYVDLAAAVEVLLGVLWTVVALTKTKSLRQRAIVTNAQQNSAALN